MSFEEKSVWVQLVAHIVVLAGYLFYAGNLLAEGIASIRAFAIPFIVSIGLVILLVILGSIITAANAPSEGRDERDRLIGWRAKSLSTHLLEVGTFVAAIMLAFEVDVMWAAQVLILSLFLEEIVRAMIQIFFYRLGV